MTDQQINIAIAEACGFILERDRDLQEVLPWARSTHSFRGAWETADNPNGKWYGRCPNYCRDLNAMHEVVSDFDLAQTVNFDLAQTVKFSDKLKAIIQDEKRIKSAVEARYLTVNATARQRAEAFLRTIGRWTEDVV